MIRSPDYFRGIYRIMYIIYMLYLNTLFIFLGVVYFFWVWKDTRATQKNRQVRWGERNSHVYYMAIGSWPFVVSILLVGILFIYGLHTLSFLGFSLYYLGTGLLYYYSEWKLLPKLYLIYGTSLYPSLGFIGFTQMVSGIGIIIGFILFSLTFGFPFKLITQTNWYLPCSTTIGALFVIVSTTRMLNHLNRHINQEMNQIADNSRH